MPELPFRQPVMLVCPLEFWSDALLELVALLCDFDVLPEG